MSILVAIEGWDVPSWVERFQRLFPERKVVTLDEPFDRREVHYVVSWKHPHGALSGLPNLAAIFSLGAGVDHIMADPRLPDAPVVRVVDADLTTRMSEYVVLHALAHMRQLPRYMAQQRAGTWEDDRFQPCAGDVRVGVMGLGELGRDAAAKLRTMGFRVAGWSRTGRTMDGVETHSGEEGLDAFLARTDILVVLLPLTEATRGILNLDLFAKLAKDGPLGGPILINAGRGGLQVEGDILAALESGVLKAASLDVFEVEPLPAESPLWTHPRVIVTPHNAAMSHPDTISRLIADQIARLESGGALTNVVDPQAGY
ncbi:2-hydroxyacid dehydrogenase [Salinarimonas ramus]|uniref:Glyoxylate/hydroxypyruvate reductase A n=1 Tax=Salinarimonas ramus TaxID=690164 RepID=A0A917V2W3_9HYPH|nr:glyoxylate/hydroxypyruvate reductase A [Salinarimonas ramus]GGK25259.1 glyoxylate/hydroxypyruvate reductase A [Salinarimonas ramus]